MTEAVLYLMALKTTCTPARDCEGLLDNYILTSMSAAIFHIHLS